jgi:hypothetical protein
MENSVRTQQALRAAAQMPLVEALEDAKTVRFEPARIRFIAWSQPLALGGLFSDFP